MGTNEGTNQMFSKTTKKQKQQQQKNNNNNGTKLQPFVT